MSQYKSAIRTQPPQEQLSNSKYAEQARQLQEFFPLWKNDDIHSLLAEVGGDVELAAARISDGTVEQWGEVSHKKDKKAPTTSHTPKPSFSPRADSRGTRGGRGGRGGAGRGGAAARGRSTLSRGNANGHHPQTNGTRPSSVPPANAANPGSTDASHLGGEESVGPSLTESHDQNGLTASISAWTDTSSQPETSTLATSISANGSAWGTTDNFPAEVNGTAPVANIPVSKVASKTPATSKLSWAQIARPEKPAIIQAPPPSSVNVPQLALEPEHQPENQQHDREEPTTAEAPTWDDEPVADQVPGPEAWPLTPEPVLESSKPEPPTASVIAEVKSEEVVEEPASEAELIAVETRSPVQALPISTLPAQVTAISSPKLSTRPPAASHRTSARHKVTDQPVTMPISFGTGIEKVGMQFGSLSLGGDVTNEEPASNEPEAFVLAPESTSPTIQAKGQPEPAAAPPASNSLASVFQQSVSPQISTQPPVASQPSIPHHSIPTSVSQPIQSTQAASSHAVATTSPLQQFAQQQALSNNNTHQQLQPQIAQHHQQQPQQQPHQQPPHLHHLPQQVQPSHATQHSYAQLGLPTHIDPSQQTQISAPQQALQSGPHSNYFRQTETVSNPPYFHTSTPPAAQPQDSPYGSFGQLGSQGQHQPSSHHGSFGGSEYGYNENQRGFYESYAQQVGFGTRNPMALDDGKGLPVGQPPTSSTLPPSNVQASQQHSSQTGGPQQSGGQGPQQTYPPPMPYYFPHAYSQNQYYGAPYSSGYVPQPFVKYGPATMFQPGPPGSASANSPAAKQPGGNVGVQPQTNPYNQALYQQGGYDDYQPHPHHSQHQHQHSHSLGLSQGAIGVGSGEYGKQLYGGVAQSGMQGFMGLGGGQTGAGGAGATSNAASRGASGSPEAAYKPYAAKDVGVSTGRGAPVQQGGQGQSQSQSQGQGPSGPQGQSFYGGNRFGNGVGGSGSGGGVGGPQAGGHHPPGGPQGHLGYAQSGSEPNFYGYQPRQQQAYWQ